MMDCNTLWEMPPPAGFSPPSIADDGHCPLCSGAFYVPIRGCSRMGEIIMVFNDGTIELQRADSLLSMLRLARMLKRDMGGWHKDSREAFFRALITLPQLEQTWIVRTMTGVSHDTYRDAVRMIASASATTARALARGM